MTDILVIKINIIEKNKHIDSMDPYNRLASHLGFVPALCPVFLG